MSNTIKGFAGVSNTKSNGGNKMNTLTMGRTMRIASRLLDTLRKETVAKQEAEQVVIYAKAVSKYMSTRIVARNLNCTMEQVQQDQFGNYSARFEGGVIATATAPLSFSTGKGARVRANKALKVVKEIVTTKGAKVTAPKGVPTPKRVVNKVVYIATRVVEKINYIKGVFKVAKQDLQSAMELADTIKSNRGGIKMNLQLFAFSSTEETIKAYSQIGLKAFLPEQSLFPTRPVSVERAIREAVEEIVFANPYTTEINGKVVPTVKPISDRVVEFYTAKGTVGYKILLGRTTADQFKAELEQAMKDKKLVDKFGRYINGSEKEVYNSYIYELPFRGKLEVAKRGYQCYDYMPEFAKLNGFELHLAETPKQFKDIRKTYNDRIVYSFLAQGFNVLVAPNEKIAREWEAPFKQCGTKFDLGVTSLMNGLNNHKEIAVIAKGIKLDNGITATYGDSIHVTKDNDVTAEKLNITIDSTANGTTVSRVTRAKLATETYRGNRITLENRETGDMVTDFFVMSNQEYKDGEIESKPEIIAALNSFAKRVEKGVVSVDGEESNVLIYYVNAVKDLYCSADWNPNNGMKKNRNGYDTLMYALHRRGITDYVQLDQEQIDAHYDLGQVRLQGYTVDEVPVKMFERRKFVKVEDNNSNLKGLVFLDGTIADVEGSTTSVAENTVTGRSLNTSILSSRECLILWAMGRENDFMPQTKNQNIIEIIDKIKMMFDVLDNETKARFIEVKKDIEQGVHHFDFVEVKVNGQYVLFPTKMNGYVANNVIALNGTLIMSLISNSQYYKDKVQELFGKIRGEYRETIMKGYKAFNKETKDLIYAPVHFRTAKLGKGEILVPKSSGFRIGDIVIAYRHPVLNTIVVVRVVGYTTDETFALSAFWATPMQADADGDFISAIRVSNSYESLIIDGEFTIDGELLNDLDINRETAALPFMTDEELAENAGKNFRGKIFTAQFTGEVGYHLIKILNTAYALNLNIDLDRVIKLEHFSVQGKHIDKKDGFENNALLNQAIELADSVGFYDLKSKTERFFTEWREAFEVTAEEKVENYLVEMGF